jgi:hypothetical protein
MVAAVYQFRVTERALLGILFQVKHRNRRVSQSDASGLPYGQLIIIELPRTKRIFQENRKI